MTAIVIQSKKPKSGPIITATAIGPFETFEAADRHATELCRRTDEYVYSVLSLVPPALKEDSDK